MDLPHSGSLNESVELLRIETNWFTLYIQGKPFHPTVEVLRLHRNNELEWIDAALKVVSNSSLLNIFSIQVFDPNLRNLIEWTEGNQAFPSYYETQTYQLIVEKKESIALTFFHEHPSLRQAVKPLGNSILSGMLNFQNEVGFTELELHLEGLSIFKLELEIFPAKMDYKQDYQLILQDVNKQIYNLSFDFMRKTYNLTGLRETKNQSLTEFFTILQHVFHQLVDSIERINVAPHHKFKSENCIKNAARVKKAGKENLVFLMKHPKLLQEDPENGMISILDRVYHPTHLLETRRHVDYDTGENRFIAWMLERIIRKLKDLKTRLIDNRNRENDPFIIKKIERMQMQIKRLLRLDFLQSAGEVKQISISLVMQMAPGYRDVYRYYLMILKGLSIQSDLFRLSMKDLAQLYEYWCFLKINHLLNQKYKLIKQDIIKVDRRGLFVRLDQSQKAKMEYQNLKSGEIFTLYYNSMPHNNSSPTGSQRPDNVLTLKKRDAGAEVEYKYIFDAKYRLNPAYEGTPYWNTYGTPGPEVDDINTMHRYRDAIVYQENQSFDFERSMFGAYVLFPYADEAAFLEHKFYKSIALVNIGAFPFLPNSTSLMEQFLDEIIADSQEKAYERSTRPRGTHVYYENKLAGKNVLVGSLREEAQLPVSLLHNFYHMPLVNITNHKVLTQLEYIAMNQSRELFGKTNETGVHWFGKIIDWKVVRRKEIKERPARKGTEEDLYVRFSIEKWEKRAQPIALGGQGIYKLVYTTKYMFDRAQEISELRLEDEVDLKDWREKRRLGKITVKLDNEDVDLAKRIIEVSVEKN